MSFIGYARVSTEEQNLDAQIDALQKAGCIRIFQEKESGVDLERLQLKACFDFLREGDTLVVSKLDRLARKTKLLLETIDDLKGRNIHFKSLTDHIDTNTPHGQLFFTMSAAFAQFERDLISERTKEGLKAARARGRKGGRKYAFNEETARMVVNLYVGGHPVSMIANTFRVSHMTIYNYLTQAKMKGWFPGVPAQVIPGVSVQPTNE